MYPKDTLQGCCVGTIERSVFCAEQQYQSHVRMGAQIVATYIIFAAEITFFLEETHLQTDFVVTKIWVIGKLFPGWRFLEDTALLFACDVDMA